MKLSETKKRHLRGLAHALAPCVHVGAAGATPAVLAELENALAHHELLKVKIRATDRDSRDAAVAALTAGTGAILITRIGNIAVLYRPDPETPRIVLPG